MKDKLIEEMKKGIDSVVNGKVGSYKIEFLPLGVITDYMKEKYGKDFDDMDTNGWQVDFWIRYKIESREYCLSGSLFYGRFKFEFEGELNEDL